MKREQARELIDSAFTVDEFIWKMRNTQLLPDIGYATELREWIIEQVALRRHEPDTREHMQEVRG